MKSITLQIPENYEIPASLFGFSPIEVASIITIGVESLLTGRHNALLLSETEVESRIRETYESKIRQLSSQITEEETRRKRDQDAFLSQQAQFKEVFYKDNERLRELIMDRDIQIKTAELTKRDEIAREIAEMRDRTTAIIAEKERSLETYRQTFERGLGSLRITTSAKGDAGERMFNQFADQAFADFDGFSIENKSCIGGQGDYHMFFKEFNVLVDAKLYTNKVGAQQRTKIIGDLKRNSHIRFAWLVSMNTKIDRWDRGPVMFEAIEGNRYICHINELMEQSNPVAFLKSVWFVCSIINEYLIKEDVGETEELRYKDIHLRSIEKFRAMRKTAGELKQVIATLGSIKDRLDSSITDLLRDEVPTLMESQNRTLSAWLNRNVEYVEDETAQIKSTDLWYKFRRDQRCTSDVLDLGDFTPEKFREGLGVCFPENNLTRGKGSIIVKRVRWTTSSVSAPSTSITSAPSSTSITSAPSTSITSAPSTSITSAPSSTSITSAHFGSGLVIKIATAI